MNIAPDLLPRVRAYIAEQHLLPPAADAPGLRLVVGLSGGPDSVALTDLLQRLGYRLLLSHCHFGLRGAEADRDLDFCADLARRMDLPLRTVRFDTRAYAAEHRLSIEMACRELRYDWWRRELLTDADTRLCVGHHADDAAETMLMNLMRGTGLRGLLGIPPRNGAVVRPLLCVSRSEILDYLQTRDLPYVTDSTNLETDYLRNKVRNLLLPLMEQINPNARHGLAETMRHLRQAALFAEQGRRTWVEQYVTEFRRDGVQYTALARAAFDDKSHQQDLYNKVPPEEHKMSPDGILHAFLQDRAPLSRPMEQEIADAIRAGKKHLTFATQEARIYLEADALILCANAAHPCAPTATAASDSHELSHHPYFQLTEQPCTPALLAAVRSNRDPEMAYLDADRCAQPLQVRRWREGDRLRPLGMTAGSKLVSDLFSNAHFSPLQKAWTWVVTDANDQILWVTGLRVAETAKVSAATRRVFCLRHEVV
jgi:tRNA(Ile)-lysidine synthase